jgi:hypothetical protein
MHRPRLGETVWGMVGALWLSGCALDAAPEKQAPRDHGDAAAIGQTAPLTALGPRRPPWRASCDGLTCPQGTQCELFQLECFGCGPVAACVDARPPSCGGFVGTPCPGVGECIDDPNDDCDPLAGGADCSGICVCEEQASCQPGFVWDDSASVCDCVRTRVLDPNNPCFVTLCPTGTECRVLAGEAVCVRREVEQCGDTICAPGTECCNPLRGICTPPGGVCIF